MPSTGGSKVDPAHYPDSRKAPDHRAPGFAVTIREEVGYVEFDSIRGMHNPAQAAMLIIADAQRDGVFEFPGPDEHTTTRVVVNWTVPEGAQ